MADDDARKPYPDPEILDMESPDKVPPEDESFQLQKPRRCSTCCCWWLFLFWAFFQFIFAVICLATSAEWDHDAGVAFGVVLLLILIVFLIIRRKDISNAKNRMCGSPDAHIDEGPVGRAMPVLKGICFFLFVSASFIFALMTFIMVVVYFQSPDPNWTAFPESCPKDVHCARVAGNTTDGIIYEAPEFNTSMSHLIAKSQQWVIGEDTQYYERTGILKMTNNFLHARFLTGFWGFADDFAVWVFCTPTNTTKVYVHSESRVSTGGPGNPNINPDRILDYYAFLNATMANFPVQPCWG